MNTKITFPELIDMVAEKASTSKRVSELFLKELFAVVSQSLVDGESVKIQNLGTFKLIAVEPRKSVNVNTGKQIEIPGHNKLTFVPDKSLAEAVNLPFAQFETVVLDDDINQETLAALSTEEEPEAVSEEVEAVAHGLYTPEVKDVAKASVEEQPVKEEVPPPFDKPKPEPAPVVEPEPVAEPEPEPIAEPEVKSEPAPAKVADMKPVEEKTEVADEPRSDKKAMWRGFALGFLTAALLAALLWLLFKPSDGKNEPESTAATTEQVDENSNAVEGTQTVAEPKAKAEEKQSVQLDTLSAKRYISQLGKKYYGYEAFWVYIYEENKDKIGNPFKMSGDVEVVIPPAEKYGIDKDDPESKKKANQLLFDLVKEYQ